MEDRYMIEAYKNWRKDMTAKFGRMIYGKGYTARLRYEGPICLDRPGVGESWTVIDPSSQYYRFTNERGTLLAMGFSAEELDAAKGDRHV